MLSPTTEEDGGVLALGLLDVSDVAAGVKLGAMVKVITAVLVGGVLVMLDILLEDAAVEDTEADQFGVLELGVMLVVDELLVKTCEELDAGVVDVLDVLEIELDMTDEEVLDMDVELLLTPDAILKFYVELVNFTE